MHTCRMHTDKMIPIILKDEIEKKNKKDEIESFFKIRKCPAILFYKVLLECNNQCF